MFVQRNHECNRGEILAKKKSVPNKNGVVGSPGKNTPTTPNPKDKKPNPIYKNFMQANHIHRDSVHYLLFFRFFKLDSVEYIPI